MHTWIDSLQVVGINHKSANLELREQVALNDQGLKAAYAHAQNKKIAKEQLIISTCARLEIITFQAKTDILCWFAKHKGLNQDLLQQNAYHKQGFDAIEHLLRVGIGLDSCTVGEPQVFGQLKDAYQQSLLFNAASDCFKLLFPHLFESIKAIKQTHDIHPTIELADLILSLTNKVRQQKTQNVVFLGAGEMTEVCLKRYAKHPLAAIHVVARTIENAQSLAGRYQAQAHSTDDLPILLPKADLLICATSMPSTVLTVADFKPFANNLHPPLVIADLAIPRDVDPEVDHLKGICLFNLDTLNTMLASQTCYQENESVRQMIKQGTHDAVKEVQTLMIKDILTHYRQQTQDTCQKHQNKALRSIEKGHPPEIVITQTLHQLTQELMHPPTIQLKKAAQETRLDHIDFAQKLLGLKEHK
ncbi:glutamyl-tRNA reductase [Gammaproteobacteria bacterium]|nr:glutamyl-tRNA reductase [Gammaproteobacteria bacterium]